MRGYGHLRASGRQIPGGDARGGIQGSLPGEKLPWKLQAGKQ